MSRREEITLAVAVVLWVFVIPAFGWIAYAELHGFDPSLCWSYGGCQELRS